MTFYIALLEKDERSLWGVRFPDIKGATTAAETADEAIRNAAEALQLWVETMDDGEAIPSPRTLDAIMADDKYRAAIAAGAIAFRVPLLASNSRPVRVNLSLDPAVLEAIDTAAKARGETRSSFLAAAAQARILETA